MEHKDQLTNEKIRKKFASQFELVNYAIKLAENMIYTGREARVKIDTQNRSLQILSEILNDKDRFDEIVPVEVDNYAPEYKRHEEYNSRSTDKSPERKKNRRILID